LDSFETYIKMRIDKENIIKIRIADSLDRFKDSLKIIERENIRREYLEKLQKQKEEQKKRVDNQKRENEEQNRKNEERRNDLILRFGRESGEIIFKGKIIIGMTEEMLIESWGKPQRVNKTITKYGTRKQYVYGSSQYIYIGENGEIETIQSSSN